MPKIVLSGGGGRAVSCGASAGVSSGEEESSSNKISSKDSVGLSGGDEDEISGCWCSVPGHDGAAAAAAASTETAIPDPGMMGFS